MGYLVLLIVGVVFTAFAALVFSLLTMLLGKVFVTFEVSGPEGWSFGDFYLRYLIVAAVFTFVSLPLGNGLLGIAALALAYKYVFDAGWIQAIVIGLFGGGIALTLFIAMVTLVLTPMGLIGAQ